MPAIRSYFIESIWERFSALLPRREVGHPLGRHKPRIPDRIVFEKLLSGSRVRLRLYWRVADEECSATTTMRRRRDHEWIDLGVMEKLREMALAAYDRTIGLESADIAVDGCITKRPLVAARRPGKARWR